MNSNFRYQINIRNFRYQINIQIREDGKKSQTRFDQTYLTESATSPKIM